jgi:hypothetical protein
MGHQCRLIAAGVVAAAALSSGVPSALASPANSPQPVAGEPSCNGLIVASFNDNTIGPSGNPTASAGPGSFFGPGTHDAIVNLARVPNCTP